MGRGVRYGSLRFSERDGRNGRRGGKKGGPRLRARFAFCVMAEEICVASVCPACTRKLARACDCTGAYPHCYGYISGCLLCKKGLGSSPYVRRRSWHNPTVSSCVWHVTTCQRDISTFILRIDGLVLRKFLRHRLVS